MGKKKSIFSILATFWFFGHRILTAWTYRISVRKWPWFFHIFRQVWTRRIGLCLQNPCEKTFNYRTSFILKDFQFTYGIGWKWISGSWVDWMKPKELLRKSKNEVAGLQALTAFLIPYHKKFGQE
ncbi:hypothetical protein GLOIN_2v1471016 [Rhizophagus irregularis DAOM 181602=DAOM 197198]|nr:hypothetical protein GLOIN_2v1471016 [Rhizophagus irregularis DAOM 181602=DAOM 197198]